VTEKQHEGGVGKERKEVCYLAKAVMAWEVEEVVIVVAESQEWKYPPQLTTVACVALDQESRTLPLRQVPLN